MADMTYAVHTATCTYLLDDEGICLWTLSPGGHGGEGTDRCVGAQFVACLDMLAPGGLVGELRLGASALFVRREHGKFVLLRTMPIERVEHRPFTPQESQRSLEAHAHQEATEVLAGVAGLASPQADTAPQAAEHFPPRHLPAPPPVAPHPPAPRPGLPPPPLAAPRPLPPAPWADPAQAARAWAVATADRASRPRLDPEDALPPADLSFEDSAVPVDSEDLVSVSVTEVTLTLPLYRPPGDADTPTPVPPPLHTAPLVASPHPALPPHPAPLPMAPAPPPAPLPHASPPAPPPAYALPPPAAPPRRASSFPPPPPAEGPSPPRRSVIGPGRRLR